MAFGLKMGMDFECFHLKVSFGCLKMGMDSEVRAKNMYWKVTLENLAEHPH